MFKIFLNAWRVQDIRNKILFILLLLLIYRFGVAIPLPGIDLYYLYLVRGGEMGGDIAQTIFALIAGGGVGSIFAMGIAPYITSSIIMQLLTYAIPKLSQMQKEGEDGRKKIQQITRYLAVGLAALQGAATVFSYTVWGAAWGLTDPITGELGLNLFRHHNLFVYGVATLAMITGTIFIMWLAELLTEKGIGNGASFLIFANILSQLPSGVMALLVLVTGEQVLSGAVQLAVILAVFIAIVAFVVAVHEGERRVPIQHAKKAGGRAAYGNHNSYIPLKVNIAGVLSIIFAISLMHFPLQIAQFFNPQEGSILLWVVEFLDINSVTGAIFYVILIFAFTHFYTSFAVNPVEMAQNLKNNGGFIPGIRPGKPTSDYIQTSVNRLAWIGSVFYSLIALTPILLQ